MTILKKYCVLVLWPLLVTNCRPGPQPIASGVALSHEQLVSFFQEWRDFEHPPLLEGAPDYTLSTFNKRWPIFKQLKQRWQNIDTTGWPIEQQVDWQLIGAELNGFDFNYRVLKPWQRDPAFYKTVWTERSDVPAHEGPCPDKIVELWKYSFPLLPEDQNKLAQELSVIIPFNEQAKVNLTGNAKELWIAGIRDLRTQAEDLSNLLVQPGVGEAVALSVTIHKAISSTENLVTWLEKESQHKTGVSGIGKENYSWYQQHVHLVPLTWEQEEMLLKRELARAWSALKLEEQRNRNLPELTEVPNADAYHRLAEKSANSLMKFLAENDIVTVKDYFGPALREHLGSFIPKETRNFFSITAHLDPRPLFSHFYHWFELAQMDREPHPCVIRREPLHYNIFDTHNEGLATAVEELFMHAGLYDEQPRSRELVYILLAQRAARGLGSLYAHANVMSMEEAGKIHTEYTPRGWMKTEKKLMLFEQQLFLRQPGYGTSYITGKYLLDELIQSYAREMEKKQQPFVLKNVLDQVNQIGCIPMSLVSRQIQTLLK